MAPQPHLFHTNVDAAVLSPPHAFPRYHPAGNNLLRTRRVSSPAVGIPQGCVVAPLLFLLCIRQPGGRVLRICPLAPSKRPTLVHADWLGVGRESTALVFFLKGLLKSSLAPWPETGVFLERNYSKQKICCHFTELCPYDVIRAPFR